MRSDRAELSEPTTTPMIEGHVHPDFWPVARMLARQIPRRRAGGAAVCVYHRGECVVDAWAGTRDAEGNAWREDTVALSYSTSKGVLATLLHILVDRGLADYDEPVCRHWPEFAQAGKQGITIRNVLCHEAGLYHIQDIVDDARRMLDWKYMVEALEQSSPTHTPGECAGYHGLTFGWLVGELIQRIADAPLRDVLSREIAEPLDLDGLYIGLGAEQLSRRALLIQGSFGVDEQGRPQTGLRSEIIAEGLRGSGMPVDLSQLERALLPDGIEKLDFNDEALVCAQIPAVNGMFTARSLARMYAMLAGGGSLNGVRLLSPRTFERATEIQSRRPGRVIPLPMHWRLGYHRVPTLRAKMPRAFGHFGFGGSGAWADPDRDLAVALVLNSGLGTPFGDTRIIRLGSAAAIAADGR
jgi:CubicO group peptidase (beta-lactamase class C family)